MHQAQAVGSTHDDARTLGPGAELSLAFGALGAGLGEAAGDDVQGAHLLAFAFFEERRHPRCRHTDHHQVHGVRHIQQRWVARCALHALVARVHRHDVPRVAVAQQIAQRHADKTRVGRGAYDGYRAWAQQRIHTAQAFFYRGRVHTR